MSPRRSLPDLRLSVQPLAPKGVCYGRVMRRQRKLRGEHGYNLFRRKNGPPLLCAVPEDVAVPRFVTDEDWAFAAKIGAHEEGPAGFERSRADESTRLNGFYLFQAL